MSRRMTSGLILSAALAAMQPGIAPEAFAADTNKLRTVSELTVTGFAFPESVAYDTGAKVL